MVDETDGVTLQLTAQLAEAATDSTASAQLLQETKALRSAVSDKETHLTALKVGISCCRLHGRQARLG